MERILVPIDFSDVTEPVMRMVEVLASAFKARVYLAHVISQDLVGIGGDFGFAFVQDKTEHELDRKNLEVLVDRLTGQEHQAELLLLEGPVVKTILAQIDRLKIDLIVMGSHGHGAVYDLMVGSVSEGVMRKAHCPVMIVPSPDRVEVRGKQSGAS